MKKLFALVLVAVMLTGCSMATDATLPREGTISGDLLVGVLITLESKTESTEDLVTVIPMWNQESTGMELPIHDISNQGVRLYAQPVEEGNHVNYEFPEGSGIPLMVYLVMGETEEECYWSGDEGMGLCGVSRGVATSDSGTRVETSATMYVDENAVDLYFSLNPVYQTASGEVYALGTFPVGLHAVSMGGCAQSISQTIETEVGQTAVTGGTVTLNLETVKLPDRYVVLQMDENSQVLVREAYSPGEMPETLTPEAGTACIILESWQGETVERTVCSPDDSHWQMEYLSPYRYGICILNTVEILWEVSE